MKQLVSLLTTLAILLVFSACEKGAVDKVDNEKIKDTNKEEVTVSVELNFGEGGDAEKPETGRSETETESPDKDDTTEKQETYLICTEMIFEPFAFTYSSGEEAGFDIELINEIADCTGFKVFIRDEKFSAGLTALANGDYNGMISAVTKTAERAKNYDFSDPYFTDGVAVIVNKGSEIKDLYDLKGKKLGVVTDSEGEYTASYESDKYGYDIVTYDDYTAMYEALENGKLDAVTEEFSIAAWRIFNMDYDMAVIPEFLWKVNYYFVVPKGRSGELLQKFNEGLEKLKDNGAYARILSNYGLDNFVQ